MDGQLSTDVNWIPMGIDMANAAASDMCVVTWPAESTPALMRSAAFLLVEAYAKELEEQGKLTVAQFMRDVAKDIRMIQGVK